ncbi:membrane protein [Comamonas testosteroni TK102]|uniref:Probable membrane transporter protein n=1 Tax=Comamonas testosteroni TK102 TaxID=1392005 RepID=A0A076PTX9_COMTE|nr:MULTISPECIES: sulfite exporter TauE/SafE family protein [Comamonas]AIJ49183.1 membrane protein [Comamonas testosteroni TK102]MPS89141.1 sulfite exporter TauE/SafE family protein [Comamonas sp.]
MENLGHLALLLAAAFTAGTLNAVAGGGSFLTLPALVFTGVPPVIANATGTVALLPGYIAGAWGFKDDMQSPPGLSMKQVVALSLIGGSAGAALLLFTPDATFRKVVPWLLLAATAMFAFGPQLRVWASGKNADHAATSAAKATAGMLIVAIYGGYFNGGLGILLLALFGLLGQTSLNAMNGMKNLVSALLTAIAVVIYAVGGIVEWKLAFVMMVAATLGGYLGARAARRIAPHVLRWGIVATGLVMAGLFFARG